uniref:Lipoprotein n=1 Tax=Picea sitchensis TaxID=3332 RepID=A0A6B9XWW2_PICSI|nr:hypothetical protein Q903MT_gene5807 [Picea sitchensis]
MFTIKSFSGAPTWLLSLTSSAMTACWDYPIDEQNYTSIQPNTTFLFLLFRN